MTTPIWVQTNAWREIFTRIFMGWQVEINVYPEWLLNPETNRRLKLDFLCTDMGIAVRLEGVKKRGQRSRRLSLEEEDQKRLRDNTRFNLCRAHGVELLVIDVASDAVKPLFRELEMALSQAKQRTKDSEIRTQINESWHVALAIARKIRTNADLKLYADLWQDRQYQIPTADKSEPPSPELISRYVEGTDVEHKAFGLGTIIRTEESGGDTILTVDFLDVGRKTLAASVVTELLQPLP